MDAKPEDKEEEKEKVAQKWAKLLRKNWGIKELQWTYHGTGTYRNELVSQEDLGFRGKDGYDTRTGSRGI